MVSVLITASLRKRFSSKSTSRPLIRVIAFHFVSLDVATTGCRLQLRYQGIDKEDRLCPLCSNHQIGDEFHYLFECPSMTDERHMYLKPYFHRTPNTLKMEQLLNCDNRDLSNLAKFCKIIMKKFD
jgi:hypothetical protein